ncbi:MAG: N-acetylmuramoyl-L-alanine amidase [Gemmatimonadota bacterium]|nr:MAG: N-acetylmuramoyl-L-alanine amidase [Gemmatimonadota bacterium]
MIKLVVALSVLGAHGDVAEPIIPNSIVVATARGQLEVPVSTEMGHPALSVPRLGQLLPVTAQVSGDWATVAFAQQPFRFLLGASNFVYQGRVVPLVGGAYVRRDTVYVPLQWLTEYVPRMFSEGYRYDPYAGRFEESRLAPIASPTITQPRLDYRAPAPGSPAAREGFRMLHKVVIDAGHGGRDPGNPGKFLPRGVNEKHITLALAGLIEDELESRGVSVVMTRTRDVTVNVHNRAPLCKDDCGLFVSIHVNSLKPRTGYQNVSGFETYFLDDARTQEAQRVAQMENDAILYDTDEPIEEDDPLSFILKDLHTNEYLRQSAELADFIQQAGARVHPGRDRGVSQARFVVLGYASRPAVLVETGFATNKKDAEFLTSATGKQRLADAIADGIVQYLKRYEAKVLGGVEP